MKPTFTTYIPVSITDMYISRNILQYKHELSSRLEDIAIQTRAEFKVWRYCSTTRAEFKMWRYCSTNTSCVQCLKMLLYKYELSSRFGDIAVQIRAEFKVWRNCSKNTSWVQCLKILQYKHELSSMFEDVAVQTRAEFKVGRYCSTHTSWDQALKILQYKHELSSRFDYQDTKVIKMSSQIKE